jgi:hypothetical protein
MTLVILTPFANAMSGSATFNCTDGYLITNDTAIINGDLIEVYYDNETCSLGCATNGIECNSPANVDRLAAVVSALMFLVAGAFFYFFSSQLKEANKKYYVLKYLHLFVALICLLMGVLLTAGIYTLGQNEITNYSMLGFLIILGTICWTAFTIILVEIENYIDKLKKMGRKV